MIDISNLLLTILAVAVSSPRNVAGEAIRHQANMADIHSLLFDLIVIDYIGNFILYLTLSSR